MRASMETLYDSDQFVVVHLDFVQSGFEIVDKRTNKEVYLHGSWADDFQRRIFDWQLDTPTQEEVEETLGGYARLAQTPLVIH